MVEVDWEMYGWVARGKQRRLIIISMDKPKIPTEIRKESKLSIPHVSKVLKDFVNKGIAECMTPHMVTGKTYKLTEEGKKIREEILKK